MKKKAGKEKNTQNVKVKDLPVTAKEFSKKAERVKGGAARKTSNIARIS